MIHSHYSTKLITLLFSLWQANWQNDRHWWCSSVAKLFDTAKSWMIPFSRLNREWNFADDIASHQSVANSDVSLSTFACSQCSMFTLKLWWLHLGTNIESVMWRWYCSNWILQVSDQEKVMAMRAWQCLHMTMSWIDKWNWKDVGPSDTNGRGEVDAHILRFFNEFRKFWKFKKTYL